MYIPLGWEYSVFTLRSPSYPIWRYLNSLNRQLASNCSFKTILSKCLQVNEALMDEYLKRVFEAVIQNEELERMSPGMGRLLVEQVRHWVF